MDFLRCYQMLDLEPGCNWAELQSAYRQLVQKWRPERYESRPGQHHIAAQRILELNEAFEKLSRHYSVYGHLPGESAPVQHPQSTEAATQRRRSHRTARPLPTTPAAGRTSRGVLAIALLVLGYALYLALTGKLQVLQPGPLDHIHEPGTTHRNAG